MLSAIHSWSQTGFKLNNIERDQFEIFKWVWFSGVCVEAKNDNIILQLLKEYLKTNLGSPASLLQSQSLKISTQVRSWLNPFVDSLEYERLDSRNVQDPFTIKTYKVMSPWRHQ